MLRIEKRTQVGKRSVCGLFIFFAVVTMSIIALKPSTALGQGWGFAATGGYGLKIYQVNSAFYPFVQVYFRTFDNNMLPLVNLNERNIGLMVKGRTYDPMKGQYYIQSIRQRMEATRSVVVLDASKSMAGPPFENALRATARFIDSKRPQDEVALIAIRDTKEGYQLVSEFERDHAALARRLADVKADGLKTRLYDAIGAAMQGCGTAAQGSIMPDASNYIVSCSVVVISDGRDEGSAISREELNTRISALSIPLPIYSIAYTKTDPKYFKNLEALSKNSFGKYYLVAEAMEKMQGVVEEIQNIIQNDYVVAFRSYTPVDGELHSFKIGVEYPSGSGKYNYENTHFEALEPPPVRAIAQQIEQLERLIPAHASGTPYFTPTISTAESEPAKQQ